MLPILRPLLHIIKRWAKPLGLNSPSTAEGSTFSSYALTLMTIGWLQVCASLLFPFHLDEDGLEFMLTLLFLLDKRVASEPTSGVERVAA